MRSDVVVPVYDPEVFGLSSGMVAALLPILLLLLAGALHVARHTSWGQRHPALSARRKPILALLLAVAIACGVTGFISEGNYSAQYRTTIAEAFDEQINAGIPNMTYGSYREGSPKADWLNLLFHEGKTQTAVLTIRGEDRPCTITAGNEADGMIGLAVKCAPGAYTPVAGS